MVSSFSGTTNPPLSRMPWKSGSVPVKSVVWEGRVSGVWAIALLEADAPGGEGVEGGGRQVRLP